MRVKMSEVVKICKKHGGLTEDKIYHRKNRGTYECRQCMRESEKKRPKREYTGVFAEYHRAHAKEWRRQNAEALNAKIREDRLTNPEKYREWERKKRYKNIDKSRYREVLKKHNIATAEYESLVINSQGLCAICKREERRMSRNGLTTIRLQLDHCHACKDNGYKGIRVVRGILCAACNRAIGYFEDNVEFLKSAIQYLEQHKHIE